MYQYKSILENGNKVLKDLGFFKTLDLRSYTALNKLNMYHLMQTSLERLAH